MGSRSRCILIVDDLRVFLEIERNFFERAGFDVQTASSGADALEKAGTVKPDAVLLDLYMPGLDGAECCRRFKRDPDLRNIAVVIITSKAIESDRKRCVEAGCDGFISKIASHSEILMEIERVLSKRVRIPGAAGLSFNVAYGLPQRPMRQSLGSELGPDGLFVASAEAPPQGTALRLEIDLPGFDRRLRLGGQVIRSKIEEERVRGFHLRFIDPEPATLRLISDYLRELNRAGEGCPSA